VKIFYSIKMQSSLVVRIYIFCVSNNKALEEFEKGNFALNNGNLEEAIKHYTLSIENNYSHTGTANSSIILKSLASHIKRATAYNRQGNALLALEDSNIVLKSEPQSIGALYQKADALLQLKRTEESLETIHFGLKINPNNINFASLLDQINPPKQTPPISRGGKTVVNVSNVSSLAPSASLRTYKANETSNATFIHKKLQPKPKGATRLVIFSDTHTKHDNLPVPAGDILIHGKLRMI
jgi:tetratricopeptide (TPR) repeat protein